MNGGATAGGSWLRGWVRDVLTGLLGLSMAFIALFLVLLVAASIMLLRGNTEEADMLAEYAYYSLVAGVALELVKSAIEEDEEGVQDAVEDCSEKP